MLPTVDKSMSSDQEILRLVWQVGNALAKRRNRLLAEYGLTGSQSEVLGLLLRDQKPFSVREIQDELMLSHPTVSGIVRRLEAKGLLAREAAPNDARLTRLRLTIAGRRVRDSLYLASAGSEALFLGGMTAEDKAQFAALLRTVKDNVSEATRSSRDRRTEQDEREAND